MSEAKDNFTATIHGFPDDDKLPALRAMASARKHQEWASASVPIVAIAGFFAMCCTCIVSIATCGGAG